MKLAKKGKEFKDERQLMVIEFVLFFYILVYNFDEQLSNQLDTKIVTYVGLFVEEVA